MAVNNEEKRYYSLMENAPATAQVSAASREAAAAVAAQERAAAKTNYSTTADGQLDAAINGYLNKNGYHYNINEDDAYREFAAQHSQNALRGREESAAGAERLANGYQPTYAQAVASEVYNDEAARVQDYAPTFQGLAAKENAARQQSDSNLISIYSDIANREYSRERDTQGDRMNYLDYLASKYGTERQADAAADSNRAQIYATQLGAAANDLADARALDNKRMQFDTVSADTRAKISESDYEAQRKLDYTKAKDAYNDRIAAQKAAKTAAEKAAKAKTTAATKAAKDKTAAEKAARNAKVNAYKIDDYLKDKDKYDKMSAADRVDLDYNGDGKVDKSDAYLARIRAEEEDVKAGKGVKARSSSFTNEFINNIENVIDSARTINLNEKLIKSQIDNANISPGEKAYLYEYLKDRLNWK